MSAAKVEKEWCSFVDLGATPSGKTRRWRVTGSGGSADIIGTVSWHGAWRQYVFTTNGAILAASCLRQIEKFLDEQTSEQRSKKSPAA